MNRHVKPWNPPAACEHALPYCLPMSFASLAKCHPPEPQGMEDRAPRQACSVPLLAPQALSPSPFCQTTQHLPFHAPRLPSTHLAGHVHDVVILKAAHHLVTQAWHNRRVVRCEARAHAPHGACNSIAACTVKVHRGKSVRPQKKNGSRRK